MENYKFESTFDLPKERNTDESSSDQYINPKNDIFFEKTCDFINNLILSSLIKFRERDTQGFIDQISFIHSFFDELYDEYFDVNSIFPTIFNPNFNCCLIDLLNPNQINVQHANEVLPLILILSSYTKNYQYFKDSHIFEHAFNLLKLNNQVIFQNCILIINKYMSSYQPSDFMFDLNFFIKILKDVSKNILFESYYIESLKGIILYIDASYYLNKIVYLLNYFLLKTKSITILHDIIDIAKIIVDIDPLNFRLLYHSKIIQNFIFIIDTKLFKNTKQKNFSEKGLVTEHFFEFLHHSFETIDPKYQEKVMKVIGIETFDNFFKMLEDTDNNKTIFIIHLIFIQYIYSHRESIFLDERSPFIAYILSTKLIEILIQSFDNQNFRNKKLILLIIQKFLKTHSNQLFSQLLCNKNANYIDICGDFALNNDDAEIKTIFLDSYISLFQIGERNGQKKLLMNSPSIFDFIFNCSTCENQIVQDLSKEILEMIDTKNN